MAAPNDPLGDLSNSFLVVSQKLAAVGNQPASLLATALQQQLQQQGAAQTAALQQQGAAQTAAMQQMQQALAALQQQGAAQTAAVQQVQQTLQQVQQQQAIGDARHLNLFPRQQNACVLQPGGPLYPLVREEPGTDLGALPTAGAGFPATREAALSLSNAALDALVAFYGRAFGQHGPTQLPERRRIFAKFIGLQG